MGKKWDFEMISDDSEGAKRAIVRVNGTDHVVTCRSEARRLFRPYLQGGPNVRGRGGEEFGEFMTTWIAVIGSDLA